MNKEAEESPFSYENLACSSEDGGSSVVVGNGARNRARSDIIAPAIVEPKVVEDNEKEIPTPDKLLALYGSKNVYLVFVWLVMAGVWGLTAMPMMVSAFLMTPHCAVNDNLNQTTGSCTVGNGTMANEFNLSGSRAKLGDYTTSAFLIGDTIGSIFLPPISDKKGRRPILLFSMVFYGFFGIVAALSPEIYSFIVIRFLQGLFFTGAGVTSWVLAYESIPIRLRSYTTLSFGLFWVTGYCIVAPLAVYIENWRWLVVAVSAPCLFGGIFYYFTIPESFHYVVSHSRSKDVETWIERANRYAPWTGGTKTSITAGVLCGLKRNERRRGSISVETASEIKPKAKHLARQMFSNRILLLNLSVMVYLWTCDAFVYYGLSLFSTQLAGNRYVNFALMGLIEIPSYIISPILLNRMGRRKFMSFIHFLATFSFLVVALFHNSTLNLLMWLLGKFAISSAFTTLFVYSSELFPTLVRNACLGVCSVVARLGGALAPGVQIMLHVSPIMPTVFFGICALIGALLTLLLPETLDRELPDSPEEIT